MGHFEGTPELQATEADSSGEIMIHYHPSAANEPENHVDAYLDASSKSNDSTIPEFEPARPTLQKKLSLREVGTLDTNVPALTTDALEEVIVHYQISDEGYDSRMIETTPEVAVGEDEFDDFGGFNNAFEDNTQAKVPPNDDYEAMDGGKQQQDADADEVIAEIPGFDRPEIKAKEENHQHDIPVASKEDAISEMSDGNNDDFGSFNAFEDTQKEYVEESKDKEQQDEVQVEFDAFEEAPAAAESNFTAETSDKQARTVANDRSFSEPVESSNTADEDDEFGDFGSFDAFEEAPVDEESSPEVDVASDVKPAIRTSQEQLADSNPGPSIEVLSDSVQLVFQNVFATDASIDDEKGSISELPFDILMSKILVSASFSPYKSYSRILSNTFCAHKSLTHQEA